MCSTCAGDSREKVPVCRKNCTYGILGWKKKGPVYCTCRRGKLAKYLNKHDPFVKANSR